MELCCAAELLGRKGSDPFFNGLVSSAMRILVCGAGAVGSVLGGLLARSGHRVALLGRPRHMAAVRRHGLSIEGIWGSHHVAGIEAASTSTELADRNFDVVLVTVKSYDTPAAIELIRQLDCGAGTILSVQNGHGNTQALEAAFGRGRVLGARIITGVELPEPGQVTVTVSADDIRLGPPDGEADLMPLARELAGAFQAAGIPTSPTDRYREFLWAKILYNCSLNPLGALLRATYGQLAEDPGTRPLIDQIIAEAFAAARGAGIPLFWDAAADFRRHFYDELIPPTARHYPSMLRDLERRGRTEIDALNGAVVQLARQHDQQAPVNEMLTALIKLREQTRQVELLATEENDE
jgi:2-dehydropantoate 2-reductase